MAKIFSAVKRAADEAPKPLEFYLPGTEQDGINPEWEEWSKKADADEEEPEKHLAGPFYIYPPSTEQMLLIMASGSELSEESDQAITFINVFYEMLDEESSRAVKRMLLDRNSRVTLDVVMQIITWAMEQAADRPTEPSHGSSPSRKNAGRASTARARRKE